MGSPDLNGGLGVGKQSPEGRNVSSEGSVWEALCRSLPLYSQIIGTFKFLLWNTLLRCTSPSEFDIIYIVLCLWAVEGWPGRIATEEGGLDLLLCWRPHQRRAWKSTQPWSVAVHGVTQKVISVRLNFSNVPYRLGISPLPERSKIGPPVTPGYNFKINKCQSHLPHSILIWNAFVW